MRCRLRYRSGWTAFLFLFTIAGVILTYNQMNDDKKSSIKDSVDRQGPNVVEMRQKVKQPVHPKQQNLFNEVPLMEEDKTVRLRRLLSDLYPDNWGTAQDADEMAYNIKIQLSDLGYESGLTCKDVDNLRISQAIKVGAKKYVDRAILHPHNTEVVIKSQGNDQETKIKCMKKVYDADKCHNMGNYHLMREIILLSVLKHPGIVNFLGFCIRGDSINYDIKKKGLLLVLEAGTPITPGILSYTQWETRLKYAIELGELLKYLEESPLGSVELLGIKMDDFVTAKGNHLKLVDLDDVSLEEKTCQSEADCKIPTASLANMACENGRCKDWNAKNNLQRVGASLFHQLLSNPPPQISRGINELKQNILLLNITANQIIRKLKGMQSETDSGVQGPQNNFQDNFGHPGVGQDSRQGQGHAKVEMVQQRIVSRNEDQHRQEEINSYRVLPEKKYTSSGDYRRIEQSNFPGQYDYTCQSSRVMWGCVLTVHSLTEAKNYCNNDPQCKAFVLFTSNPDGDSLMTMVAKNSGTGKPQPNVGATLFIRTGSGSAGQNLPQNFVPKKTTPSSETSVAECRVRTWNTNSEARITRERRLMTHLGLKGISEDNWKLKVKMSRIVKHAGLDKFSLSSTVGGRFEVELANLENTMRKAVFLYEKGPSQYHIAHLLQYHLDRILGIYQTPPTVVWSLTVGDVADVEGDKVWTETLGPLLGNKDDIKGLLSIPVPPDLKPENLTLVNKTNVVNSVTMFNKSEKLQLEQLFLRTLSKSDPSRLISHKGHLIHFGADGAFQDLNVNLLGYFNNCQFPNVVYKALSCFKCSSKGSQICSLGQEAMQRILSHGYTNRDIKIQNLTPNELTTIINDAATSVLSIVDTCIKNFGRDQVLY
ncbi:uncharacterized protein LOC133205857 isoform X2 [Saccostrea echinata]|uniref:uncharacterized protein LOC133205857 isoform X2 n=1 Tax=Saccostrea echinata TaxID=191078 RepID=UPI002A7FB909|nr:uncharacterized protein LOC133205857 isoform X2 [Saccostrea echinata]